MAAQSLEIKNKILAYVKRNGPLLPVKISKEIGSNTIFAGAILSQLIAEKQILITNGKIGGSPLYYVYGQEAKLEMLHNYMNEKEKKAFLLLKENFVLRDKSLEPWQRVALRELKDFAVMLKVIDDNKNEEIFWKWYLTSDGDAEILIKKVIGYKEKIVEAVLEGEIKKEAEIPGITVGDSIEPKIEQKTLADELTYEKTKEIIKLDIAIDEEQITKAKKSEKKKETDFRKFIQNYFSRKDINLIEEAVIKKNNEFEYICNVPSGVGKVRFFLKIKNKKKISDNDILLAHSQAQLKGLPLLFLSNGELTKKGREYLNKNHLMFDRI